jgi:integrase
MTEEKVQWLRRELDRHGNLRWYVKVTGAPRKHRMRSEHGTPAWWREYAEAVARLSIEAGRAPAPEPKTEKGTVAWVIDRYLESSAWLDLDEHTRLKRTPLLAEFRTEHGDKPAGGLHRRAVMDIQDRWKVTRGANAANHRLKAVRGVYRWAAKQQMIDRDATREVPSLRVATSGYHTWTAAEIARFVDRWPIGTSPYVAMAVMLCTGARIGDAYKLGPTNLTGSRIRFRPSKTADKSQISVSIPVMPMLREALAAGPTGETAWIVGTRGRPFAKPASLGNAFKGWCRDAGLPHCSAHGLRKGGATFLAQRGATEKQLMAVYGWSDPEMAHLYTKAAERERLAEFLEAGFGLEEDEDG